MRLLTPSQQTALIFLLARRDEPCLEGLRGSRLTQTGSADRMVTTYLRSARIWVEHRAGVRSSWTNAVRNSRRQLWRRA